MRRAAGGRNNPAIEDRSTARGHASTDPHAPNHRIAPAFASSPRLARFRSRSPRRATRDPRSPTGFAGYVRVFSRRAARPRVRFVRVYGPKYSCCHRPGNEGVELSPQPASQPAHEERPGGERDANRLAQRSRGALPL